MPFTDTTILLTCHSLEDFPTHLQGAEADSLLACWTALWHPQLLALTGQKPGWRRSDAEIPDAGTPLVLVPRSSQSTLPLDLPPRIQRLGGRIIEGPTDRGKLLDEILAELPPPQGDEDLVPEFLALGYAFLQVQLMTRQLRGSSALDETAFEASLVEAAQSWSEGRVDPKPPLDRCFDQLLEEKNNYYPVTTELIELVLTTNGMLGESLVRQLDVSHPQNWLVPGRRLRRLLALPEFQEALPAAVAAGRLCLVSGVAEELPYSLLEAAALPNQLEAGQQTLSEFDLEVVPLFAQRRSGLSSTLPGVLESCQVRGALHASFESGRIPEGSTSNIRWAGERPGSLSALAEKPLDASRGETYLRYGIRIGEQIDSAHLSTQLLVHWPNRTHFAFDDLARCARRRILGRFSRLDDYLEHVYDPGYSDTFTADEYVPGEYLRARRSDQRDPVSRWVRYYRRHHRLHGLRSALLDGQIQPAASAVDAGLWQRIRELQCELEWAVVADDDPPGLDARLDQLEQDVAEVWRNALPRAEGGCWILNAGQGPRTASVRLPEGMSPPAMDDHCRLVADGDGGRTDVLITLEAGESAWLAPASASPGSRKSSPPLVVDQTLRNEFLEVIIDPERGGVRGINLYDRRHNLVSQRLGLRIPATDPNGEPRYAEMICDDLRVVRNTPISAAIETRGRLVDADRDCGGWRQRVTVERGSRIVTVEGELDPTVSLGESPGHYYCSRLAWRHEEEQLIRGTTGIRAFAAGQWLETTSFIEWVDAERQWSLLCGGLPWHCRSSARSLDTILIPRGESVHSFRFGIGVNIPYGHVAAAQFANPPWAIAANPSPATPPRPSIPPAVAGIRWDPPHVVFAGGHPLQPDGGPSVGVALRFAEVQGRAGSMTLRLPRPVGIACRTDFTGEVQSELPLRNPHELVVDFYPFDYFQIHLNWDS